MFNIETFIIFILACFIGYYVVLKVTPALHAPLMSVTNAISSVIIIVALDAVAIISYKENSDSASISLIFWFAVIAVFLTAINIVGGFMLTKRMLDMFPTKKKNKNNNKGE